MRKIFFIIVLSLLAVVGVQANIVNLSTISDGKTITLHAGDTVVGSTGSSDINIQVAKGAVVTFKNVHINEDYSVRTKRHAGISPLGNATLVFIGKNVVRGFTGSEPGIFAPRKCALNVMGSGTLEASCGKFAGTERGTAAGIGAGSVLYQNSKGNIVYTDVDDNNSAGNIRMCGTGTFTAIGGEGSAGIGGGYETSCGWIEIMNTGKVIAYGGDGAAGIGTGAHHFATESSMSANCDDITIYSDAIVEAYGGRGAAGIGGGWSAHCGDIVIAEDVRHIRATKGEGAPFSIGEGAEGAYDAHLSSCESVRIGNRYYPEHIAESPFVYPCGQVSNIRATEIGQTQATIKWDPYYDEQEWTIAYVILNSGYSWTIAHSSEPFITLTDLKPGKEYMVEVRTECGSTHSDYTDHIKFVTREAIVPTEVKIVSLESGSGGSPLMITYDMMDEEGRKYSFGFPNDWPVEGHTYTLDEMLPAYSYTWKYGENKSYFVQAEMNVMYYSGNAKLKALRAYAVDDQGRLWDMKYDADELVSCLAPTSIYLRVITENSATFTWFGGSEDATEWEVRYRPYNTSSWTTKSVSAKSYKITGLEPGTKYEAQFRTKCSSTEFSEWTASYVFTTDEAIPEPCLPPSGVTATEITETSARISWTPGGKELAWQLSYITTAGLDQGGEEWKYETAYTNSFVLSSLTASTEYLVQIRAICSDDNQSEWNPNAEVEFTTLDPPAPCYTLATNVRSYYISASTASVLWDADGDAESWQLCYRKKGASSWYWVYPTVSYRDLTGLEELTTYEVRVRAKCGDRSFGEWSDIHEFTTNDVTECDQPQSVTVDDVTNHEVYISWVPGSESDTKWRYYFRPEDDSSWGSNSSTKPSVKLYVRRGTKYYFRVATQCGSGGMESYWIETSFTSLTDAEQAQKEADAAAAAAALEAAREALEAAILDLQILRNYADEYNVSAVVTILDNAINAANEVYMNEDATLDELNDATASARYVANSLKNAFVEAAKIQFKNLLDDMLNDCNSECCQQVISDAKAAVNELSLNTDLSTAENIAVLLGAGEEIYDTAVEAILACKEQDTPDPEMPLNLRASEIKDNSALIAWDGEAENFDLRYKEAVMGPVEYDFSFSLGDWRAVDADGDGYTWNAGGWLSSESYITGVGALSPDNWLISPQIMLGGNISFEARGLNDTWYAEHFAVYVSTTDTDLASFTQVSEEFVCESSQYAPYEVDLDGSGPGYVAIRHFNCSDQFALNLKNIVITMLAADPQAPWNEIPGIEANAFMLESLDSETTYAVQARSHNGVKASEWTPSLIFTTEENTEAIENIFSTDEKAQKILYQNQLFILRGGKIYTVTGQVVK